MSAFRELERWRQRQLEEYQRAQIIDGLDRQRVLAEYQLGRLDDQGSDLASLVRTLAGVETSASVMAADLARLTAVAGTGLPNIARHVAQSANLLDAINDSLANPQRTAAAESFRNGVTAFAMAVDLSRSGSTDLSRDWLRQAARELRRATKGHPYGVEAWQLLALATAQLGFHQEAARAFEQCAFHAVTASPRIAAWAVLMAAETLRHQLRRPAQSRALLTKYSTALSTCAELHLALAIHHGDTAALQTALELAPTFAADARIHRVAAVEQVAAAACRQAGGPVVRLRAVDRAVRSLAAAALACGIDGPDPPDSPVRLPRYGVDALLKAEASVASVVANAHAFRDRVLERLDRMEDAAAAAEEAARDARQRLAQVAEDYAPRHGGPAVEPENGFPNRESYRYQALLDFLGEPAYPVAQSVNSPAVVQLNASQRYRHADDLGCSRGSDWGDILLMVPAWQDGRWYFSFMMSVPPGTPGSVMRSEHPSRHFLRISHRRHLLEPPVGDQQQALVRAEVETARSASREYHRARLGEAAQRTAEAMAESEGAWSIGVRLRTAYERALAATAEPLEAVNRAAAHAFAPRRRLVPAATRTDP